MRDPSSLVHPSAALRTHRPSSAARLVRSEELRYIIQEAGFVSLGNHTIGAAMDFQLSTEQRMIRDLARRFAEQTIKPVAAQYDHEERFPHELLAPARELGLLHLTVPTELGGPGLGALD